MTVASGPASVPTNVLEAESGGASIGSQGDADREILEARLLTAEAELRELTAKAAGQRHKIRWIAVSVGLLVIASMLGLLGHTLHVIKWWPIARPPSAFLIVIVAAPIASITTITIALFVGAFKKFEEKDAERAATGLAAGLNIFRG